MRRSKVSGWGLESCHMSYQRLQVRSIVEVLKHVFGGGKDMSQCVLLAEMNVPA